MPSFGFPVVFNTDYSFFCSSLGLYLSYHTASHYAILDSSPEGIWFAWNQPFEPGQQIHTGASLYVAVEIFALDHWLYWPGSGDVYWSDVSDNNYEIQLFTDLKGTQGVPINVGDAIYFYFPQYGGYLVQDPNDQEYLTVGGPSNALAWTVGTNT
jgi:hypothetical protein